MPDAGGGVEAADAGAAGADALGQRALRDELHLQLAGQVLLLEDLVLPDVGRDHLPDLAGLEEHAQPLVGGAAVVGDDGQVLHALAVQGGDEVLGVAAQAEAADQQGGAVGDVGHGRRRRWRRPCSWPLHDERHRLAAADAEAGQAALPALAPPWRGAASPGCARPSRRWGGRGTTAPPFTLTFLPSRPSSCLLAIETTAKASLISQRSMSFVASPALASVFLMASAGAMVNSAGSRAAPPQATRRASTVRPSFFARSALMSTTAAAPSLMDEALAAVTVPSFLKTGFRRGDLVGPGVLRPVVLGDHGLLALLALDLHRDDLGLGRAPAFCASMARRVDSTANSSCAAREMPGLLGACLGADPHVDARRRRPTGRRGSCRRRARRCPCASRSRRLVVVGDVGHRLHAARHHHVGVAERDGLRGGDDRLQPGAAHLVERPGRASRRGSRRSAPPVAPAPAPRRPAARCPSPPRRPRPGSTPARASAARMATAPRRGAGTAAERPEERADGRARSTDDDHFTSGHAGPRSGSLVRGRGGGRT